MCGIFGYVGPKNGEDLAIKGLKYLEYRGYDSAGLAGVKDNKLIFYKDLGKVSALEEELRKTNLHLHCVIAHTRWATHGKPSKLNAHPHFDMKETLAIVHNGIIENHNELRHMLVEQGIRFSSETDTEVVAQLIGFYYEGDLLKTIQKVMPMLKGAFAMALVHKDYPDNIFAFANQSPLVIGIGHGENFLSSDSNAFSEFTREVIYLTNSEIADINRNKVVIYSSSADVLDKESVFLEEDLSDSTKGDYEHFTLKEIYEQPQTLANAIASRYLKDYGNAYFENLNFGASELLAVERILILACGTSWHAGYVAAYMLEELARIPVQVEISSEFRYKNPVVSPGTFVIAISQSGETADTLAAVRELKAKGSKVLSICNVTNSTLVRETDSTIFLRAGREIGVCSTKAYTSQVIVLALFTLFMARMRHMGKQEGQEFVKALEQLPDQVQAVLDQSDTIREIAERYADYQNFFFLGRSYMYPTCQEGALKLKEISYINANAYPAGEMKHGPIALINEECPSVAFCANKATLEKLLSNLMEVKARSGLIIAIAEEGDEEVEKVADEVIWVPRTIDQLATIPSSVAAQLFAYWVARKRGADIDHPRNLAKSVVVE